MTIFTNLELIPSAVNTMNYVVQKDASPLERIGVTMIVNVSTEAST